MALELGISLFVNSERGVSWECEPLLREAFVGLRAALGPRDEKTVAAATYLRNLLPQSGRAVEADINDCYQRVA